MAIDCSKKKLRQSAILKTKKQKYEIHLKPTLDIKGMPWKQNWKKQQPFKNKWASLKETKATKKKLTF